MSEPCDVIRVARSHRLQAILNFYGLAGKKHFVSLKLEGQSGARTRDLRLSKADSFNQYSSVV